MDKLAKFELMEKIVRELDDLRNSQTAVLKKIGQIEVENIELNDKTLEDGVSDLFTKMSETLDAVTAVHTEFSDRTDQFSKDNNLVPAEDTVS
ncbi:hypothetical protein [Siphonobacter sp.]|uniref:hypothetical protein n=1 Tax=Siphonobacter sp. TaxID=1869184 RepID=UPI003B3A1E70